jgi:hypothetical protein
LVEQLIRNQQVLGSSPSAGSRIPKKSVDFPVLGSLRREPYNNGYNNRKTVGSRSRIATSADRSSFARLRAARGRPSLGCRLTVMLQPKTAKFGLFTLVVLSIGVAIGRFLF